MNRNAKTEARIRVLRNSLSGNKAATVRQAGRLGGLMRAYRERLSPDSVEETRHKTKEQRRREYLAEVGRMEP